MSKTGEAGRSKKDIVTQGGKGRNAGALVFIGVLIGVGVLAAFFILSDAGAGIKTVRADDGVVRIPVGDVSDGTAHYYKMQAGGKEVKFFVLKSSDGKIRAAFDACDTCYEARKGYRQEGDLMVCNNCGLKFPSVKINEIKGGCNPAPLARAIEGETLVLKEADIVAGGFYF